MEILLLIFGFLRDQPVQLYRCRLVCHQWYHVIDKPKDEVRIRSEEDAAEMVRIMVSQENRRFGRLIESMFVIDNPSKPFAHCLPLRLQGEHFTKLGCLKFENLNWTAKRPHPLFFRHISYLSKVKRLLLRRCRLHRADDLWNLLSALPSLQKLGIDAVSVELDLFGRHTIPPSKVPELWRLTLASKVLPRSIIDVLSLLSCKVTKLDIGLDSFSAFDDLEHLICALPALDAVHISGDPPWEFPTSSSPATTAKTWTDIRLYGVSYSTALGVVASFPPRGLRRIIVSLRGAPSPSHSLAGSLLKHYGATLTSLEWVYFNNEPPDASLEDPECALWASVPSFDFVHNIVLERICIDIPLPSTPLCFYQTLLALLSSVVSPRLRWLLFFFTGLPNWEGVGDFGLSEDAMDTFHACLLRDVFAGLRRNEVVVRFMSVINVDVRAWLVELFTPWLARGILGINLPDGSVIDAVPETLPLECS
ncbi:hypothetical protein C8Q72DRAFT_896192 [Fomitopsis betulina]|nr:hypothetical protein C8Q72DRAFT_896192 [Fomitopsis betulina]